MQSSAGEYSQASSPVPADGALSPNTWVSLSWSPGYTAVSHDVYFGENFDDVEAGTEDTFQGNQTATYFAVGSARFPYLVPGVTYYWRVDEVEVRARGTTTHKGDVWRFTCNTSAGLPAGWSSRDIGSPRASGSASYNDAEKTWTVRGDGHDIWGSSDAFHFAYIQLSGDGMIFARVLDNGSGSDSWAKGGVMIRETLDANSKHAMMILTGGEGAGKAFQCRPSTGSYSLSSHGGTQVSPPLWVKLVRQGNLFTGYYSVDGVDWEQQPDGTGWDMTPNPIEINMTRDVYIGVCVTSVVVGEVRTYTFDNVRTELPKFALRPEPADGAKYVNPNVELSWSSGSGAQLHIVYFGDNFDDVNIDAGGILREATTYTPGPLEWDKVYYWRVDEFDGAVIHKGEIWSFRTIPEIDPNLIGWWRFDEGSGNIAYDSSGNGNDGTFNGDPQWMPGHFDYALEFDGSGDWLDCGEDPSFQITDAVTVSAWIKVGAQGIDHKIGGNQDGVNGGYKMTIFSNNRVEFEIRTSGNTYILNRDVDGGIEIEVDVWYHVTGVYSLEGGYIRTYVNGALDREMSTTDALGTSPGSFIIGCEPFTTGSYNFNGVMDDLRIYNQALTEGEILGVMEDGEAWPFSFNPEPADGALNPNTWVSLSWSPGYTAVSHDVYFGDNFYDVEAGTKDTFQGNQTATYFAVGSARYPYLVPGVTYYWRVDEVEADGVTIHKGDVWSFLVPSKTAYTPKHFEITYYDNYNYDTDQWDAWQSETTPRDAWDDKYLANGLLGNTVFTDHAFTSIAVFNLRGNLFSKDGHPRGGRDWNPLKSIGDNVSGQSAHHVFAALFKGLIYLEEGDNLMVASDDDVYVFLDDETKWGQEVLSVPYTSGFDTNSMTVTAAQAGYHTMTVKFIERLDMGSGIEITVNGEHLQSAEVAHLVTVPGTACLFFAGQDRAILEADYPRELLP